MNTYVLLGGSGTWNLIVEGVAVAGGHIPATAPKSVIGNQARRFSKVIKKLGGGNMLDLAEVGLSEQDAIAIAKHNSERERNRLRELAMAFKATRKFVEEGWVAVGQSPYPRSGIFMERDGERKLISYD